MTTANTVRYDYPSTTLVDDLITALCDRDPYRLAQALRESTAEVAAELLVEIFISARGDLPFPFPRRSAVSYDLDPHPSADPDCEVCRGRGLRTYRGHLPGLRRVVVERCDLCSIYESDIEAARVIAQPRSILVVRLGDDAYVTVPGRLFLE